MKKILIIGAGFAGLSAAGRLSKSGLGLEITLLDRKGAFNFLPLIPDCIGRRIKPEFLCNDIAALCRKLKIRFIREEVTSVDLAAQQIQAGPANHNYGYLIISSGSQPNFFSNPDAQAYGYSLNNVEDVRRIINCLRENNFENIIICGAGYTGVEAATNLWLYFKKNRVSKKIIMVERAPSALGPLPDWMKGYAGRNLKNIGIEVLTNTVIEKVGPDKVLVSGGREFMRSMLIWVPGVKTAEFIQKLDIPKNAQGRIAVDEYLRFSQSCFCAGDTAFFSSKNTSLRMAVQFAITQGDLVAQNIIRSIKNMPLKKYRPLDLGYIIPMANNCSCGQVMGVNVSGWLATLLHFSMCIFRSVGWVNRAGIISNLIKSLPVLKAAGSKEMIR